MSPFLPSFSNQGNIQEGRYLFMLTFIYKLLTKILEVWRKGKELSRSWRKQKTCLLREDLERFKQFRKFYSKTDEAIVFFSNLGNRNIMGQGEKKQVFSKYKFLRSPSLEVFKSSLNKRNQSVLILPQQMMDYPPSTN